MWWLMILPGKKGLEETMRLLIAASHLPTPRQQYKAIPGRRYSWDFAWPEAKILLEVQGGTWMSKGGHNTGSGINRDNEKANLANIAGWCCLAVTKDHIKSGQALEWVKEAHKNFPPF